MTWPDFSQERHTRGSGSVLTGLGEWSLVNSRQVAVVEGGDRVAVLSRVRWTAQSAVCLRVTDITVSERTTPEHLFDEDGMEE